MALELRPTCSLNLTEIRYDITMSKEIITMNSLAIEISEKVRRAVDELDKSIDSPECSDKIAEIDKTIKIINEHAKSFKSDNSTFWMKELFQKVVDYLKEAKSALEPEETGDYKKLIWDAYQLSHHIEVKSKNRISK
ncbi:MAG: hypothetical protein OXN25_21680 [Candidatus Poribacteria bacterium]|nr:hypothetical protein [Candidatus Poribacteria bacterium]